MAWTVVYHPEFLAELKALDRDVADKLRESAVVLAKEGPHLGRPLADTLQGSKHSASPSEALGGSPLLSIRIAAP